MKFYKSGKDLIIEELKDFDLGQTIECGQCFHFLKLDENEYGIAAFNKLLHIRQSGDSLRLFDTSEEDFNKIWLGYFDLERDYSHIKTVLLNNDEKLADAVNTMWGVRILNQEFFETLISFIISQNQQIPRIKKIVQNISEKYGTFLGELGGEKFYSFPNGQQLANATVDELRDCKTGFRAPYIMDAVEKINSGFFDELKLRSISANEANEKLMCINGVGPKVANCVSLFGLGHREAFPVDVWIKRIMENLYFDGADVQKDKLLKFGESHFGEYGGYAQQYLFYYGKANKVGVKNIKKI